MPLYEYQCPHCEKNFDKLQDEPERSTPCIFCGSRATRVFTPTNFHLKGAGWPRKELKETNEDNRN